ncbi:hypothetical protein [Candidatus Chlorohelix sp.]|uniref:hypothetical protein n=1 Tax=Candidatus Chlorohelix sp. TaxID=3139201 RepID=UPI00306A01F7
MKVYRVSNKGKVRAEILLITIGILFLYTARKTLGLWQNSQKKDTDLLLFGINLNSTFPALLLSLIALACIPVCWYLLVELFTHIEISDSGIGISAPGYRIYYRWSEVSRIDVLESIQEDAVARLGITTNDIPGIASEEKHSDTFLSEPDRNSIREERKLTRQRHKQRLSLIQTHATRADGRALSPWTRLLYPQARRPDQMLLYPALNNRADLLAEIKGYLKQ